MHFFFSEIMIAEVCDAIVTIREHHNMRTAPPSKKTKGSRAGLGRGGSTVSTRGGQPKPPLECGIPFIYVNCGD
jgi:hypothetical protein